MVKKFIVFSLYAAGYKQFPQNFFQKQKKQNSKQKAQIFAQIYVARL
jgi:hypothetical protein